MSDETKQRVNIQFSIDLSELPSEVSRLFGKSCTHTQDAENLLHEISSDGHTLSVGSLADIDAAPIANEGRPCSRRSAEDHQRVPTHENGSTGRRIDACTPGSTPENDDASPNKES